MMEVDATKKDVIKIKYFDVKVTVHRDKFF
jgi:hypothetical protein